jgi:hypothetical protein
VATLGQAFKSTVKKGQFWAESTVTVFEGVATLVSDIFPYIDYYVPLYISTCFHHTSNQKSAQLFKKTYLNAYHASLDCPTLSVRYSAQL